MKSLDALMMGLTLAFSAPVKPDEVQRAKLLELNDASPTRRRSGSTRSTSKQLTKNRKAAKAARKARKCSK